MSSYIIPFLFLTILVYSAIKKVKPYDAFTEGAKSALPFAANIFPYLVSIFVLTELFEASGISDFLSDILSPVFGFLGIPKELSKLVMIKPFSGSGSLAMLSEIFSEYGADSYLARCACVIYGSSETVFYIAAVYFANVKNKKLLLPIIVSLFASFCSCVFAWFICKIM